MKQIFACALAIITAFCAFGKVPGDSVKVYFHISQWQYDPALDGNAASMDAFIESVRSAAAAQNLDRIVISAYASPEGGEKLNDRLAAKRCQTITSLIVNQSGINANFVESHPGGVAWDELRRMVEATPEVPSRDKVLDIIDNTPLWVFNEKGRIISGRKKQLMDLRGGRPWRWMLEHLFPALRNSLAVSFYLKPEVDTVAPADSLTADTVAVEETIEIVADTCAIDEVIPEPNTSCDSVSAFAKRDSLTTDACSIGTPRQILALKTNLLYYGLLLPNLSLEWLITPNWSVAVEGNLAAWGSYKHNKSYRLTLLDAEGRRWIKPRAPWHGMYVGLMAGGGWYDLLNGSTGHYGWGVMSGVTFGYMWPIGRRLSLEAGIGLGYLFTRYKDYKPIEGHHVYQRTKELSYVGPIKLNFSIAWRFLDANKPKQVKTVL